MAKPVPSVLDEWVYICHRAGGRMQALGCPQGVVSQFGMSADPSQEMVFALQLPESFLHLALSTIRLCHSPCHESLPFIFVFWVKSFVLQFASYLPFSRGSSARSVEERCSPTPLTWKSSLWTSLYGQAHNSTQSGKVSAPFEHMQ